jgi:tRNA(adenine34) deaminase
MIFPGSRLPQSSGNDPSRFLMNESPATLESDRAWMRHALDLSHRAGEEGEVPVGAVIVQGGLLLGEGWNRVITLNDPSAHAEILAMREAGERLGNYRLPGCSIYITLEPCAMCAGAMLHARLEHVYFGAGDPKTGALGGNFDLFADYRHNHHVTTHGGVLENECSTLLKDFFRSRREPPEFR